MTDDELEREIAPLKLPPLSDAEIKYFQVLHELEEFLRSQSYEQVEK